MEIAGLAFGASGLIPIVEKSLSLCRLVDDIRDFAQDTAEMLFRVENEADKAQCWAIEMSQYAARAETPSNDSNQVFEMIQSRLQVCVLRLQNALNEAQQIIQSHNLSPDHGNMNIKIDDKSIATGLFSTIPVLNLGARGPELKARLVQQQRLSLLSQISHRKKAAFIRKPWSTDDRESLNRIIQTLAYWNGEVWSLLSRKKQEQLEFQIACQVMSKSNNAKTLEVIEATAVGNMRDLAASAGLSLEKLRLENGTVPRKPDIALVPWAGIHFLAALGPYSLARVGKQAQLVLVEWTRYGHLSNEQNIIAHARLMGLCSLLSSTQRPPKLQTLSCVGYIDDVVQKRYGVLLEDSMASESPHQAISTVYSLVDIMKMHMTRSSKRKVRNPVPSLTQRFQLARKLAYTFMELHNARWLHKGFNSQKVIFFLTDEKRHDADESSMGGVAEEEVERDSLLSIDFDNPHVVGFEFARQSGPDQVSLPVFWNSSKHIYTHPDLHQDDYPNAIDMDEESVVTCETKYTLAYDMYSLGLVLAEIGLWQPLSSHVRDASPEGLRRTFLKLAERNLGHTMGTKYRDVVLAALKWEPNKINGVSSVDPVKGSGEEDGSWTEDLNKMYWDIVRPLEECACGSGIV